MLVQMAAETDLRLVPCEPLLALRALYEAVGICAGVGVLHVAVSWSCSIVQAVMRGAHLIDLREVSGSQASPSALTQDLRPKLLSSLLRLSEAVGIWLEGQSGLGVGRTHRTTDRAWQVLRSRVGLRSVLR